MNIINNIMGYLAGREVNKFKKMKKPRERNLFQKK